MSIHTKYEPPAGTDENRPLYEQEYEHVASFQAGPENPNYTASCEWIYARFFPFVQNVVSKYLCTQGVVPYGEREININDDDALANEYADQQYYELFDNIVSHTMERVFTILKSFDSNKSYTISRYIHAFVYQKMAGFYRISSSEFKFPSQGQINSHEHRWTHLTLDIVQGEVNFDPMGDEVYDITYDDNLEQSEDIPEWENAFASIQAAEPLYKDESINSREENILRLRFEQEMTYDEIEKIHGVSRERVRFLVSRSLRKFRHPSRRHFTKDVDMVP